MTESEAYLFQARGDLAAFWLLEGAFVRQPAPRFQEPDLECQALHYLQMATEKLGKAAYLVKHTISGRRSHGDWYFRQVWGSMQTYPLQAELGLTRNGLTEMLARCDSVRTRISQLQPEVAHLANPAHVRHRYDSLNVVYPWENPPGDWHAPGHESFGLLVKGGLDTSAVIDFVMLVDALITHFSVVFP
jgi:hypothetical protein